MRCASWNVNGLRAIAKKGFADWLGAAGVDLALLQETKVDPADLPDELREVAGMRLRLHAAARKGYSGVGIYHREEPDEWIEGVGDPQFDAEGRLLCARYGKLVVGSVYFPNSQAEGARLGYRLAFGERIREFIAAQRKRRRHVVLGGDFNVAHRPIDLARPKQNEKNPGYLPEERDWMDAFLAGGQIDTWRHQNPDAVGYTWWSFRAGSRERNVGWRLDYFCVDAPFAAAVRSTGIEPDVLGSDHCPVRIELDPA